MPRYFLGVDGGQSSTVALIADEHGRILGRGSSGPCKHVSSPETEAVFLRTLSECLEGACSAAALLPMEVQFEAACLGFSGGTNDKEHLARSLIRAKVYKITHDAEVALWGASGGYAGIIVIAGTGSMAFGRNQNEQIARAGGWGYVFGDEGGAFDIARQALRCGLRFEEGWGPATALHAALLAGTGSQSANVVLHRFYEGGYSKEQLAQLASTVSRVADQGDLLARDIIRTAADALAVLGESVYHQLFKSQDKVKLCPIGGVFQNAALRSQFAQQIKSRLGISISNPFHAPAAGAVLAALRIGGVTNDLQGISGIVK